MLKKGTLGPGILGKKLYDQELHETTEGRGIFGPGITGEPKAAPEAETETFPSMSVNKLKDTLVENPAFLDSAIETEFKREPGPRRGALRRLIEFELEGQNRDDVLTRLEDALE
jgi:hypothetical protein